MPAPTKDLAPFYPPALRPLALFPKMNQPIVILITTSIFHILSLKIDSVNHDLLISDRESYCRAKLLTEEVDLVFTPLMPSFYQITQPPWYSFRGSRYDHCCENYA